MDAIAADLTSAREDLETGLVDFYELAHELFWWASGPFETGEQAIQEERWIDARADSAAANHGLTASEALFHDIEHFLDELDIEEPVELVVEHAGIAHGLGQSAHHFAEGARLVLEGEADEAEAHIDEGYDQLHWAEDHLHWAHTPEDFEDALDIA